MHFSAESSCLMTLKKHTYYVAYYVYFMTYSVKSQFAIDSHSSILSSTMTIKSVLASTCVCNSHMDHQLYQYYRISLSLYYIFSYVYIWKKIRHISMYLFNHYIRILTLFAAMFILIESGYFMRNMRRYSLLTLFVNSLFSWNIFTYLRTYLSIRETSLSATLFFQIVVEQQDCIRHVDVCFYLFLFKEIIY